MRGSTPEPLSTDDGQPTILTTMKLKLIYLLILTLTSATMAQDRKGSALVITGSFAALM